MTNILTVLKLWVFLFIAIQLWTIQSHFDQQLQADKDFQALMKQQQTLLTLKQNGTR